MTRSVRIEIASLEPEDVEALRAALEPLLVGYSSGLDGRRFLRVAGEFTRAHAARLREVLLRLLGEEKVVRVDVTRGEDQVVIESVHGAALEEATAAAERVIAALDREPRDR